MNDAAEAATARADLYDTLGLVSDPVQRAYAEKAERLLLGGYDILHEGEGATALHSRRVSDEPDGAGSIDSSTERACRSSPTRDQRRDVLLPAMINPKPFVSSG